ncbi:DMT family transporter [uncultured Cohaesibacter sp.]|uniref:DMT family transporter n=1 Tax=uncultured Cohaesibacter sp. TaxID=1002546 RepID=UPI00292CD8CF|nr:DMT family transporter [uncultured Cohaesibacter sp.]
MSSMYGIGLKLLSTVFFAVMLAIIKYTSSDVPIGEVIFARCFFALFPLVLVTAIQGDWRDCIRTKNPWAHVRRSVVGAGGMFCWFSSVSMLPLPEATAISFLNPLMVVALAAIFLKEVVRIYRWSAVGLAFFGVLIILWPRLSQSSGDVGLVGAILCVTSTFFMASAGILIRHMTKTEKNAAIVFYFFVATSVFSLVSLYWGWVLPDLKTSILLILAGVFGGLGQIIMTKAVSVTEVSLLAPFDYVNMIWNVFIGIVLFSEYPTSTVLVGAFFVIGAGLFVLYRERQLGLAQRAEKQIKSV